MNVFEFLASIGGLVFILYLILSRIVAFVSKNQFLALIANTIYTWDPPSSIKASYATSKKWAKQREENAVVDFDKAETEMTIGRKEFILYVGHIAWIQIFYNTLGACCKKNREWWVDYKENLENVETNMNQQMDIVKLIKNRRAFTLGLSILFDHKSRNLITQKAHGIPIEIVEDEQILWGKQSMFKEQEVKEIKHNQQIREQAVRTNLQVKVGNSLTNMFKTKLAEANVPKAKNPHIVRGNTIMPDEGRSGVTEMVTLGGGSDIEEITDVNVPDIRPAADTDRNLVVGSIWKKN